MIVYFQLIYFGTDTCLKKSKDGEMLLEAIQIFKKGKYISLQILLWYICVVQSMYHVFVL